MLKENIKYPSEHSNPGLSGLQKTSHLFQGKVKNMAGTATTTEMEASDNPALVDQGTDPTLVCSAFKKNR